MVLPGFFYQAVRERLGGARPSEQETGHRILRAVAASVLLDACYAVVAGPWLVGLAHGAGDTHGPLSGLTQDPRRAGLAGLLLIVAVPTGVAWLEVRWAGRGARAKYEVQPTAWDALFRRRGSCFVRIKLKDGTWLGGWYGKRSYASAYPHTPDLYLQAQYVMKPDGAFDKRMTNSGGVYVQGPDIDVLEIIEYGGQPDAGREGTRGDAPNERTEEAEEAEG